MLKSPARSVSFLVILIAAFAFPSSIRAQENPAKQQSFDSGPAGAYSLSVTPGPNPGQATLTWKQISGNIGNFHVVYGTSPNNFQYGALNIDGNVPVGKTISFTISYLSPGTKYYFALSPIKGGKAQSFTFQVASYPAAGVVTPPPTTSGQLTVSAPPLKPTDADSFKNQPPGAIKNKGVGLHQLSVKKGKPGEETLEWKQAFSDTDNYDIVYGTEPGKFQYGALNVGKTTSFTVKGLDPNKHYYFALVPVKGGKAQYITQQVTDNAAPVVSNNQPSGAAGTTGGGQPAGAGGGAVQVGVPGQPSTTGGGGKGGGTGGGQPAQSGQSGQSQGGGKSEGGKQTETKKVKKQKVKGASTIFEGNFDPIEWLKSILLR